MPAIATDFQVEILPEIIALRHAIHRHPDLSGREQATVDRLLDFLEPFKPDEVRTKLGGCGLAVVFNGTKSGPVTVITCELDAVPITDHGPVAHASRAYGVGHMCGHDGHMATVAGLGALLGRQRPDLGRVILLFRPQEETGLGAPAVAAEPWMVDLEPDFIFGFHNMPGHPQGAVLYRRGQFAWAATDYVIDLRGRSSHGGQPGVGQSPALALARIIEGLENLTFWCGVDPAHYDGVAGFAQLGDSDYGTTPGKARLRAVLRSRSDAELEILCAKVKDLAGEIARSHSLQWRSRPEYWIPATHSHDQALDLVLASARAAGLDLIELDQPQRWSDDFGVLTRRYPGAYFGLGAGADCGNLHGPDYDFPDAILGPALQVLWGITALLNRSFQQTKTP